ncbi:MAG: type II secretion system protein [Phycisphaerales bacterium]
MVTDMRSAPPSSPRAFQASNEAQSRERFRQKQGQGQGRGQGRNRNSDQGFTLVEVLVTVATVSLLIGLTLPALSSSRARAREGTCLSVLRTLGQAAHDRDGPQPGTWPTLFERGRTLANYTVGDNTAGVDPVGQSLDWCGPILNEEAAIEQAEAWSCPSLVNPNGLPTGPARYGGGFWYSSAFFTDPRLWDPSAREARLEANLWAAPVARSETRHPALKVMFAETAARHTNGHELWSRHAGELNAVFADGHADRVNPLNAKPAFAIRMPPTIFGARELDGVAVPFSSAAWGIRGRDF